MKGFSKRYSAVIWKQFRYHRLAYVCWYFILFLFCVALFAPVLANDKPLVWKHAGELSFPAFSFENKYKTIDFKEMKKSSEEGWMIFPPIPYSPTNYNLDHILEAPNALHLLGTDGDGRDVAAQLIWGARVSLSVGFVAVGLSVLIGVFLGALAGFYGGVVDVVISRLIEVMICFPTFFLILAVLAFVGPSIFNIMLVIGVTGWPGIARLIRAEIFKFRERDFILAAHALGASDFRVVLRHLLPNAFAPVLVSASFGIAGAILAEAGLSFLGFGVPPQVPSWGSILSQAQEYMDVAWWLTLIPGVAIFITVTAYNLVGEGLRDALDPKLKQ